MAVRAQSEQKKMMLFNAPDDLLSKCQDMFDPVFILHSPKIFLDFQCRGLVDTDEKKILFLIKFLFLGNKMKSVIPQPHNFEGNEN